MLLLILTGYSAIGQVVIDTDRPDQTESATVLPKYYFQLETGLIREKDHDLVTFVHPTALWKYGIHKRLELRLITELVSTETPIILPAGNKILTGLLPIQIGSKISLWEEKGLLPKTSLIAQLGLPASSSKKFRPSHPAPNFRLAMAHTLGENFGLGYNLGAEWDGENRSPHWIYSIAPGYCISEKWYLYIEFFGSAVKGAMPQNNIDGGVAYNLSDNCKLDLSLGKGISKGAIDKYIALGFSFRVKTKNNP